MPKLLIFVLIVFIWDSGQVLDALVRYPIKMEYYIWNALGTPWLHFALSSANLCIYVIAIAMLLRPKPIGLHLSLFAAFWTAFYGAMVTSFAINNLAALRDVYMKGREIRGFSTREEAADLIFTPSGMWGSYSLILLLSLLVAAILFWKRQWFQIDQC